MGATVGPLERVKVELTLSSVFCETFWMKGNCGVVKGVVMPDWSMNTMPKPDAYDSIGREHVGEADAGGDVVEVELAGAAGVAVDAEVIELLGGEVEDGALVGLFGGGEVEGLTGAEVEGEAAGDAPIILNEVLLDLVAGADLAGLEVDLEGVDLAEEEAGDGVAAVGDALLVGSGGGEGEGAGGVGGRDGVEFVPAEVDAGFEGVAAASEDDGVDELPDGGLVQREGAGGGAELLESGEGKERESVVEGGVGGDAGDAEGGGCGGG